MGLKPAAIRCPGEGGGGGGKGGVWRQCRPTALPGRGGVAATAQAPGALAGLLAVRSQDRRAGEGAEGERYVNPVHRQPGARKAAAIPNPHTPPHNNPFPDGTSPDSQEIEQREVVVQSRFSPEPHPANTESEVQ